MSRRAGAESRIDRVGGTGSDYSSKRQAVSLRGMLGGNTPGVCPSVARTSRQADGPGQIH